MTTEGNHATNRVLWILDNGHGKATPGKRSPLLPDGRQLLEYEFNRDIVDRIQDLCLVADIETHILVPEVEGDISLAERARRANALKTKLQKVLISVHANASGTGSEWHDGNGIETFALARGGTSERIAQEFQRQLVSKLNTLHKPVSKEKVWRDRGVKYANFAILRLTNCPAILTENGFFTNRAQCEMLLQPATRQAIAEAHVQAMVNFTKTLQL